MTLQLLDAVKVWAKNLWAVDQGEHDAYEWHEVKPDDHAPDSAPDATVGDGEGVPPRDGDDDRW